MPTVEYDQNAHYTKDKKSTVSKPDGKGGWVTPVEINGSIVQEQKAEADAVDNVITFSEPVSVIEIYHDAATRQQFIVNGITLYVPPGSYRTPVGGTPSNQVIIPAGVSCIVGRLV